MITDADDVVAAASKVRHQQNHDQRVWNAYLKANKINQVPSPNSCVVKGNTKLVDRNPCGSVIVSNVQAVK